MKQYVLTPNEAALVVAQQDDFETSIPQLAVDARLLPDAVAKAAEGLHEKGLLEYMDKKSAKVCLTDNGRQVRKLLVPQGGSGWKRGMGGAIGVSGGGTLGGLWLGGLLGTAVEDRVLILPSEDDRGVLSPEAIDAAIDEALRETQENKEAKVKEEER